MTDFNLPLVLDGSAIRALVIGGGGVGGRKARALLDGGASVRVVATSIAAELQALSHNEPRLTIENRSYAGDCIGDEQLIVAATNDRALNTRIGLDARRLGRLVNVVDNPESGTCVTPAVHRTGAIVVAVVAGGVPTVAVRVRDRIARLVDGRYADAARALVDLRTRLLADDGRERWREALDDLVTTDFCDTVEAGAFLERIAAWR